VPATFILIQLSKQKYFKLMIKQSTVLFPIIDFVRPYLSKWKIKFHSCGLKIAKLP
jgi:hypothetical protein